MTPREALERFKQPIMLPDIDWNKRVQILENALNRLEALNDILGIVKREVKFLCFVCDTYASYKKWCEEHHIVPMFINEHEWKVAKEYLSNEQN